mmetsp:Transcript_4931/g.10796  ORF Transcript_4931/g.10796 Transcript_4931/m.10796 type:complete len:83 (+) Transcript_4931:47-295(+)
MHSILAYNIKSGTGILYKIAPDQDLIQYNNKLDRLRVESFHPSTRSPGYDRDSLRVLPAQYGPVQVGLLVEGYGVGIGVVGK